MAYRTPKPRFAINGFVVAYHPTKRVVLHYYPRTRSEGFAVCLCEENWQVTTARGSGSLDSALRIGEDVFDVAPEAWLIVSDDVEPWTQPTSKIFEQKRLGVLAELRRRQSEFA